MANSFLKCNPHPEYHKSFVKPYTIKDIDEMPNRGRMWATIMQIRMEAQEACNRARELGYQEGLSECDCYKKDF